MFVSNDMAETNSIVRKTGGDSDDRGDDGDGGFSS